MTKEELKLALFRALEASENLDPEFGYWLSLCSAQQAVMDVIDSLPAYRRRGDDSGHSYMIREDHAEDFRKWVDVWAQYDGEPPPDQLPERDYDCARIDGHHKVFVFE